MTKPGDDDRTGGRSRTRWGRRQAEQPTEQPTEQPAEPPETGTTGEPGPAPAKRTPRRGRDTASDVPEAPVPLPPEQQQTPAGAEGNGEGETPRPGPHLEYARPDASLRSIRELGFSASVLTPPPTGEELAPAPESAPAVPIYRPVDRAVLPPPFFRKIEEFDDGTLDFTVYRAYNFPSGGFPGDPGRVPVSVDPRVSVCWSLAAGAAYRCLRGGGYF